MTAENQPLNETVRFVGRLRQWTGLVGLRHQRQRQRQPRQGPGSRRQDQHLVRLAGIVLV